MIDESNHKKIKWALEQKVAKELFNTYPLEFLNKVSKPSFPLYSIMWFKTDKGKKFLQQKLYEFKVKPKATTKPVVEHEEKFGEDIKTIKQSVRDFLNG